jgi:cell division protein FtsB
MRIYKFDIAVSCACIGLLGFFAWHAWQGPRGFHYRDKLSTEVAGLQTDLDTVSRQRHTEEQRVALMRPDQVDPDMLDEMARFSLDMAKPNELVLRTTP